VIRALLGGTFDPVHRGHVAMVDRILADGLADCVHVVPAARSPHKDDATAPAAARLAMVRLAMAGRPDVVVEDLEIARGGVSYTVDTLTELAAGHKDDLWRLVVGSDILSKLDTWREPARLLAMTELLVVPRGGWDGELPPVVGRCSVVVLRAFDHPDSATAVRRELAAGRDPGELLPDAVADYVRAAGLYGVRKATS
jgi:nicotinate-nucleotide adenylyltransferase